MLFNKKPQEKIILETDDMNSQEIIEVLRLKIVEEFADKEALKAMTASLKNFEIAMLEAKYEEEQEEDGEEDGK